MKINSLLGALSVILVIVSCGEREKTFTKIEFETDFRTAGMKAAESDKPMIIDFYTDWGEWCDSLDANTYVDPLVMGMSADNIFVKINAEVDTNLARDFGISGYPTIVITKSNGEEIDRIWGYLPPTDFYNQVQLYLQGKETLIDYLSRLDDDPDNQEYISIVAEKYTSRREFEKALDYYGRVLKLDPDNENGQKIEALGSMYDVKGRAKDYDGAIETAESLVQQFPDTEQADDARAIIGYYTNKKGDSNEAMKLYRAYLESYPDGENASWVKKRVADLEDKK
ncbi:MAG: thioredoxin domain-containing protein [candidate division Zixibacteria bacterium]